MKTKSATCIITVALIAGAAGFAAGTLLAPKSGPETRKQMLKAARKAARETVRKAGYSLPLGAQPETPEPEPTATSP